jgi:polyisoprenoid-binding protein YceI
LGKVAARLSGIIAAATLCVAVPAAWASQAWRYALDSGASDVSAKVAFLGLASKTARFPAVTGRIALQPERPDAIDLDVTLDARALRASDSLTLDRLRGPAFFDVANHPTVRFTGTAMQVTGPRTARVSGELTARGVTRPQVLAVTFDRDPAAARGREPVGLIGRMTIDRRDYGMTAWSAIVGNKVDITIRSRMVPE